MATRTLGTNATTSLTALSYLAGYGNLLPADVATLNNAIKDDLNPAHPIIGGSFTIGGSLYIPRRGWLQLIPGDFVAVDSRGWPIVLSADTAASGPWTHT